MGDPAVLDILRGLSYVNGLLVSKRGFAQTEQMQSRRRPWTYRLRRKNVFAERQLMEHACRLRWLPFMLSEFFR